MHGPPELVRVVFTLIFISATSAIVFSEEPVLVLPLAGFLHAIVVHAPAIWSKTVHQRDSLYLLENIVYYFLLQFVVLAVLESFPDLNLDAQCLWTIAGYFALYYAWRIYSLLDMNERCTLSHGCLTASLACFLMITMPIAMVGTRTYGVWRVDYQSVASSHFMGMVAADALNAAFNWLDATFMRRF